MRRSERHGRDTSCVASANVALAGGSYGLGMAHDPTSQETTMTRTISRTLLRLLIAIGGSGLYLVGTSPEMMRLAAERDEQRR